MLGITRLAAVATQRPLGFILLGSYGTAAYWLIRDHTSKPWLGALMTFFMIGFFISNLLSLPKALARNDRVALALSMVSALALSASFYLLAQLQ